MPYDSVVASRVEKKSRLANFKRLDGRVVRFFVLVYAPAFPLIPVLCRDRPACDSFAVYRELHSRPGNVFHIRLVTSEWVWWCLELGRLEPPLDEHRIVLYP